MAGQEKGAILDPSTHSKGGAAVPDGEYIIKSCQTDYFDYNGTQEPQPALLVLYAEPSNDKVTHEQAYTAGKSDRLIPSDDKKRFVHPKGEAAVIAGGSNVSLFISAIMKAGFPTERLTGDDVTVFAGTRVQVTNVAQPSRPGLKDQREGKTIPLPTRVVSLPGENKSRPTTAKSAGAQQASAATNGDNDSNAIQAVLQALKAAPEQTLKVKGLAVRCLKYANGAKLNDLSKLLTADWLESNGDAAGWVTDGDIVSAVEGE